jgi:hypothetical protein
MSSELKFDLCAHLSPRREGRCLAVTDRCGISGLNALVDILNARQQLSGVVSSDVGVVPRAEELSHLCWRSSKSVFILQNRRNAR